MALTESEKIAIGVCVPLGVIILAVVGFFIWFKLIRVKVATFKVSYVDDNGNIRNEEITGESEEAKQGEMTAEATPPPNHMTTTTNNNNIAATPSTIQMNNVGVPVFNPNKNNNLQKQTSISTTTTTTRTTRNPGLPFVGNNNNSQTRIPQGGFVNRDL